MIRPTASWGKKIVAQLVLMPRAAYAKQRAIVAGMPRSGAKAIADATCMRRPASTSAPGTNKNTAPTNAAAKNKSHIPYLPKHRTARCEITNSSQRGRRIGRLHAKLGIILSLLLQILRRPRQCEHEFARHRLVDNTCFEQTLFVGRHPTRFLSRTFRYLIPRSLALSIHCF